MKINTGHRVDKREHGTTPGVQSDGEFWFTARVNFVNGVLSTEAL